MMRSGSRQKPSGAMSASRRARSGYAAASSQATMPPNEWPTKAASVSERSSSARGDASGPRRRGLPQAFRPPVVHPMRVVPEIAEARQHLVAEELDVLHGQLVRHRPDLQEHHQIPDVETADHFLLQTVAHGGGAAGDDVALFYEVAVPQILGIFGPAHGIGHGGDETAIVLVARRREPYARHMQALVVEVLDVPRELLLGARIALGYDHQLQESPAIRVEVAPLLGDHAPVP